MDVKSLDKGHLKKGRVALSSFKAATGSGLREVLHGGHIRLSESESLKPVSARCSNKHHDPEPR